MSTNFSAVEVHLLAASPRAFCATEERRLPCRPRFVKKYISIKKDEEEETDLLADRILVVFNCCKYVLYNALLYRI